MSPHRLPPHPPLPAPRLVSSHFLPAARCYCGNLPWTTGEEDLRTILSAAGNIVNVTVYRYKDGRSKGCGIVEFSTPEEANYAISSLNDVEVGGRKMQVREVSQA